MKKAFLFLTVLWSFTFYFSCTKDKTKPPLSASCSGVDSLSNTYNLKIKAILDANCAYGGCHDAGSASSSVVLDSYLATKSSFQNKPCLCTIKQSGGCLPMPQGSDKLADSLITYIQCWSERGYPQ